MRGTPLMTCIRPALRADLWLIIAFSIGTFGCAGISTGHIGKVGDASDPPSSPQPWSGIIDPSRAIDWSSAGVPGGIPNRTTQCGPTVKASGDTTGITDVSNINNAIQYCANSPDTVVQLGGSDASPQTFYICGGITFGSPQNGNGYTKIVNNVTLRGGGPMATILKGICFGKQEEGPYAQIIGVDGVTRYYPSGTYTLSCGWTAGYTKGSTLLTLSGCTSTIAVGMVVILDQRNSSIGLVGCTASGTSVTCTTSIPHNYTVNTGRACPDQSTDCVFVGNVTDSGGTNCTSGLTVSSYYNTGCNTTAGSAPITAITRNTFTYSVTTAPPVASSTATTGYSDVDTGGMWVTNATYGSIDELAGNGRQCPDSLNAQCQTNEISYRAQAEVKKILGICTGNGTGTGAGISACQSANQVIIDSGLYHNNWSASQAPGLWSMDCNNSDSGTNQCGTGHNGASTNYAQGVGVENMTLDGDLDGGADTSSLFSFYRAYGSWAKNVRCLFGDRNCIWIRDGSAHITLQDSYVAFGKGSASQSYGAEMYGDVGDVLISNSIFQHVPAGIMFGGCFGCVSAYNYLWDDASYASNTLFNMEDLNHDFDGFILDEGNDQPFCHLGNDHGTISGPLTVFRTRCRGQTPGGPLKTNALVAVQFAANNRGVNLIGSVLGWCDDSLSCGSNGIRGQMHYQERGTFNSGYVMALNKTGENFVTPPDPFAGKSLYCWGNFDVINNAVEWATGYSTGNGCAQDGPPEVPGAFTGLSAQAVPASHDLPASFYYSAKPYYWTTQWGTPKWPPIGPDVAGGNAPDCVPAGNCMSDNLPAQLAVNNLPVDANYLKTNTITGATWTNTAGGTITWTGRFTTEVYDTFLVSGAGAYNTGPGGQEVIASSGPQRLYLPTITAANTAGAGLPAGNYSITLTLRQSNGGETHPSPITPVTTSGGNNSFVVAAPPTDIVSNGGGLSVPGDAAVSYA